MQSKELLNCISQNKPFRIPYNGTFAFQTRRDLLRAIRDHMFVPEGGTFTQHPHCEPIQHSDANLSCAIAWEIQYGNRYDNKT